MELISNLTVWATVVMAVASIVSAWAAIRAVKVQNAQARETLRHSQETLSVELLMRLDDRFNSKLLHTRAVAAGMLADKATGSAVDDILDFFETVGYLVRGQNLSSELVWHTFYHTLHRYYLLSQDYIAAERREHPRIWSDLTRLHEQLVQIERNSPRPDIEVSQDELREFIVDECRRDPEGML